MLPDTRRTRTASAHPQAALGMTSSTSDRGQKPTPVSIENDFRRPSSATILLDDKVYYRLLKASKRAPKTAIEPHQRLRPYDLIKALKPACSKWRSYESASVMPSS